MCNGGLLSCAVWGSRKGCIEQKPRELSVGGEGGPLQLRAPPPSGSLSLLAHTVGALGRPGAVKACRALS